MKKLRAVIAAATLAGFSALPPAWAAGTHGGGHGGHDMGAMPAEMKRTHDEMEARLKDTSAFGVRGDPDKATRTVRIEAAEIMYNLESIDVKLGETVKFVLVNKGEQAHELTVGDRAYQDSAREMMTMMAEMGMEPASPEHEAMHASAGNTAIAQPGQSKEFAWTFTKPGTFEFACNIVGHSEAGMKGVIVVK